MTQPKEEYKTVEQEKGESTRGYCGRLLASMFEEVYSHTGRQMPTYMYDRCHDFVRELQDVQRDEESRRY